MQINADDIIISISECFISKKLIIEASIKKLFKFVFFSLIVTRIHALIFVFSLFVRVMQSVKERVGPN